MRAILQFMYEGEVRIPQKDMDEFMTICDDLKVRDLSKTYSLVLEASKNVEEIDGLNSSVDTSEKLELNCENFSDIENSNGGPDSYNEEDLIELGQDEDSSIDMEAICPVKESVLKTMKQSHTFTRYACAKCDYMATKTSHLKRHIQVKHEDIYIACNICEYKAKCRAYLMRHMLTHDIHAVKKFSCPSQMCDYQTSEKGSLNAHIGSKHDGVKFSCNDCEYETAWRSTLRKHKKMKHSTLLE